MLILQFPSNLNPKHSMAPRCGQWAATHAALTQALSLSGWLEVTLGGLFQLNHAAANKHQAHVRVSTRLHAHRVAHSSTVQAPAQLSTCSILLQHGRLTSPLFMKSLSKTRPPQHMGVQKSQHCVQSSKLSLWRMRQGPRTSSVDSRGQS